ERVPVRLLPGATREALTLDRQYVDFIPVNGDAATLDFHFAPGDSVFRLILADRIGVIAIDALAFFAGEREAWRMGPPSAETRAFDAVALDQGPPYALVRHDAWIEPQLPPELAAHVDRISITLRWTGDWTGAGAFAALIALSNVLVERSEAAHRE